MEDELRGSTDPVPVEWSYADTRADASSRHGALLAGRYLLRSELARGGMGVVFRAEDTRSGREVAVKRLLGSSLEGRSAERFLREGQATARLSHPNVIRILDAGMDGGAPFLVYDLIEGARALDLLFNERDLEGRVRLIRDAARGLGHAHAQGIVHRDVKPENVLVTGDGHVLVADFGVALQGEVARLTRTGAVVGTPFYMAPEQLLGQRSAVGPPADVWSLGVILHLALHGELPFLAANLQELMARVTTGRRGPAVCRTALARRLDGVCRRALSPERADRYADGDAFADALEEALADGAQEDRSLAPLVPVALVVALGSLVGIAWAVGNTTDQPARASTPPSPAREERGADPAGEADAVPLSEGAPGSVKLVARRFRVDPGVFDMTLVAPTEALVMGRDPVLQRWDLTRGRKLDERWLSSWSRMQGNGRVGLFRCGQVIVAWRSGRGLLRLLPDGRESTRSVPVEFAQPGSEGTFFHYGVTGEVHWVRALDGQALGSFSHGSERVVSAALSPTGDRLAIFSGLAGRSGALSIASLLEVYDLQRQERTLRKELSLQVRVGAWSDDGQAFWVGTISGRLVRVDLQGEPSTELLDPELDGGNDVLGNLLGKRAMVGTIHRILLSADPPSLHALGRGQLQNSNALVSWRRDRPERPLRPVKVFAEKPWAIERTADGKALVVGTQDGYLEVIPLEDPEPRTRGPGR